MNRQKLLVVAGMLALSAAAPGFASPATTVRAEIPFAFYAGELLFPPGSYVITVDDPDQPEVLTIRERNGKEHEVLLGIPDLNRRGAAHETTLVFDRQGKDSFLSQIWIAGLDEGRAIPRSEVEQERAALLRNDGTTVVPPGHVER